MKKISVVVPLFNEEGNVERLHREIVQMMEKEKIETEIIFVDDGSSDETLSKAKKLKPVKVIALRGNFGQTAALDAGIKAARGEIIITMDGDLQNDPADIPRLLKKMEEGFDVVSGWRKKRKDSFSKKFLSRGADLLRKILVSDGIHDSGCTLKAYRKECFDEIDLYGEMHRFIPAVLKMSGFTIGELEVNHRARDWGQTKYNWKRVIKGALDMLSIWFWRKFSSRPLHLFGGVGIVMNFFGVIILIWMFVARVFFNQPLSNRIWPIIGIFLMLMGFQFLISGLLADILIKTYQKTKKETYYKIRKVFEN